MIAGRLAISAEMLAPCDNHEPPKKGRIAIAMRVENHTANRVSEFCRRVTFNTNPAKIAMSVPSTRQSTI